MKITRRNGGWRIIILKARQNIEGALRLLARHIGARRRNGVSYNGASVFFAYKASGCGKAAANGVTIMWRIMA
jgi:hypothetical protein